MNERPTAGGALDMTTRLEVDSSLPPATPIESDRSALRHALDTAITEAEGRKLSMKDLTVLAPQNDPFRLDTAANHRDGAWLAMTRFALVVHRAVQGVEGVQGVSARQVVVMIRLDLDLFRAKVLQDADCGAP